MKNAFLILLLLFAQQLFATRLNVNGTSGNDANNGKSWAQAFKTFQKAIDASKANDEIWLTGGRYCPERDFLGFAYPSAPVYNLLFFIDKPLLIYGHFNGTESDVSQRAVNNPPTVFSGDFFGDDVVSPARQSSDIIGQNTDRILDITMTGTTGKIRLDDIVFTASIDDYGLYLGNCGADVTVYNCSFIGNFSSKTDGIGLGAAGIGSSNGKECSPVFDQCIFENNASTSGPGAVRIMGYDGVCKPRFLNSTFRDNSGVAGGAVYVYSSTATTQVTFSACDLIHNDAGLDHGGAISAFNSRVTCNSCTIQYNHAESGGAIYAYYMNGANNLALNSSGLAFNDASSGGAITLDNADAVISGCEISNNTAGEGGGGAIFIIKPFTLPDAPNTLVCKGQTLLHYNQSAGDGGAVCNMDNNTGSSFEHVSFLGNSANHGGAFCLHLDENGAQANLITECKMVNNEADQGGAVYIKQERGVDNPMGMAIRYSTLYGNHGQSDGDQIYADHGKFIGTGLISWTSTPGNSEIFSTSGSDVEIRYSLLYAPNCSVANADVCEYNVFGRDPLFENPEQLNFYLKMCSPAINAAEFTQQNEVDMGGANRPYNDGTHLMDMGAYEYQGVSTNCVKALCKNLSVSLGANGSVSVPANALDNGSTGCTALSFQIDNLNAETFQCNQAGDHIATMKVTDCMGNSASCNALITVRDDAPPVMKCKAVTLLLNAAGTVSLNPAQVNNGSYDNCGITALSLNQTQFSCAQTGPNQVTLSGNDAAGNQSQCYAIITVRDMIAPVAKCRNLTANLNSDGQLLLAASAVDNGSTDNCGVTLSLTPASFQCGNVGYNTVTLRATDMSGNSSSCQATVLLKDLTAPNALCRNATVTLNDLGNATLSIGQIDNGSSDACGIASMTLSKTQFNCSDLPGSAQTVTLTVKDVNQNMSTCQSQVSIKDLMAPTAVCNNTSVQLGVGGSVTVYPADLALNSFDNCSVWTYSPTAKVYTAANLGANNLSITVKDWSGNAATCVSVVNVLPHTGMQQGSGDRDETPVGSGINLAPNPSSGSTRLSFELQEAETLELRVLDLSGRTIQERNIEGQAGSNQSSIDLQGLPDGVYLVSLRGKEILGQKRLVLQSGR